MTPKQHRLYYFIEAYERLHGYGPTFDEMCDHLQMKSKGYVHAMVGRLIKQGKLQSMPRSSRSVTTTKFNAFYLKPETFQALKEACAKEKTSMATAVEEAVQSWLGIEDGGVTT